LSTNETRYQWAGLAALALLAAFLLLGAASCGGGDDGGAAEQKVQAVTTLELFADLVRNVGGDRVEATALLPSGADPHTFELPPDRVASIAQADIVFMNGLGLEATINDVVENNAGGRIVRMAEGLSALPGDPEEGEEFNPHLWLDVRNASRYVEKIRDALIEVDPDGRDTYVSNADAYLAELDALDGEFEAAVQTIPEENRKLVTFHDAYPYLASRYGLEIVGVAVPSPGQEPNAQDIADLTEALRTEHVPAVFKEPQFNAAVLEAAADDAGVQVFDLLSDAFTDDVHTYVDLMRYDMQQLKEGLGGTS
jgi:ABC-type Zn uptake system ZnuABC Zn-binding protein ZnuA